MSPYSRHPDPWETGWNSRFMASPVPLPAELQFFTVGSWSFKVSSKLETCHKLECAGESRAWSPVLGLGFKDYKEPKVCGPG